MSFIARKVGRKYAANQLAGIEPEDPHYEQYTDTRGKQRKRKRPLPAGLSKRDERVLRSVRRRAHYLDKGFSICGFRFGWTAILGLIPGAGDIAQFLLGYSLVLAKCKQAELPASLVQRMLFNQLVGLGIGLVPLVGDLALAVFKANSRNAALLEDFLVRRAAKSASSGVGAPAPTAADEEELAQAALLAGRIDRRSGEKVGGAKSAAVASHDSSGAATTSAPAQQQQQQPALQGPPRKFYGWGGGSQKGEVGAAGAGAPATGGR
ncbi:hypothetical protein JCM9279_005205 [Rhodotorula babjevae]